MKKAITYLFAMCFCATASMAQNGSPYWSTSGNNNATGASKLGTTNNISLHFFTNNAQRMYIDSANGRVGIGVTSPQDRLHVNSASGENAFRAQVSGATKLLVAGNGGTALGASVTPPANGLYVLGNTGLGNAAPVYKLQVKGDIDIDSGAYRFGGDPVLKYNVSNQSIALGNAGGTGTRLNTAVGYQALNNNTTGQANVAIGHKALLSDNTGYSNIAVGSHALYSNTSGYQLIAVGDSALYSNTTGLYNIAIGSKSLYTNNTGAGNTATGYQTLYNNTTGTYNVALGYQVLYSNTTGGYNSSFGNSSLRSNTTGYYNTAGGYAALYSNTTGNYLSAYGSFSLYNNSSGSYNSATGYASLYSNTSGSQNTGNGYGALEFNTTGGNNTSNGYYALLYNTTGSYLTATGSGTLFLNSTGSYNSANGYQAFYNNTSGYAGTADGYQAGYNNTTAYQNTAIGYNALYSNATSNQNTAVGSYAMNNNTGGGNNVAVGSYAGYYSSTNGTFIGWDTYGNPGSTNSTAIGYHAPTTADNQVRVGDGNVTSIGGQVGWSSFSDGRFKKNIKENVPGLTFINQLRPITYNIDAAGYDKALTALTKRPDNQNGNQKSATESVALAAKSKIIYTGFVAQEVETTAKKMSYDFSGVDAPKNSNDFYGLRYADFVPPLVKAVQELSKQIDSLQKQIDQLKSSRITSSSTGSSANIATQTVTLSSAALLQNVPNPFSNNTTIQYNLPSEFSNAKIVITDKAGRTLKTVSLNGSSSGSINVETSTLSGGTYQYSLFVDGRLTDTKQMLLSR